MIVIIVTGPSASGKTTLVNILKQQLENAVILSMDQYYLTLHPTMELDWDDISAFDLELMVNDVQSIIAGEEVYVPIYDYVEQKRHDSQIKIHSPDVLIIEGIFSLYDPQIREIADLSLYIDADPIKVCLKRRIERDALERGRSVERVVKQYFSQVYPGYEKYTLPSQRYADLCYLNEGEIPALIVRLLK